MSLRQPRTKPIITQIRDLAADRSSSPLRLMVVGVIGVMLLATFFMTGTFTAISFIDNTAIAAEQQRAALALERVLGEEASAPDAATAQRIAAEYLLGGARIAPPGQVAAGEVFVTIPGSPSVFAWTPRRLASEAFD